MTQALSEVPDPGRPVVFRNGVVLTMDDAHTVLFEGDVLVVDDRIVDLPGVRRTVQATVEHLRSALSEEAWAQGMNPDLPSDDEVLDNPYQYTNYKSDSTHGARGTVFGEPGSGN